MKKYIIVHNNTLKITNNWGVETTLYRIKALKDFGDVKAGDLGGWIQTEKNLSQEGTCWVYGKSMVYDENTRILDNAKVYNSTIHSGTQHSGLFQTKISGYAKVYDSTISSGEIYENATIRNSTIAFEATVSGNAFVGSSEIMGCKTYIAGNARVYECSKINNCEVRDDVTVCHAIIDNSQIKEKATVEGGWVHADSIIGGNLTVRNCTISDCYLVPTRDMSETKIENAYLKKLII